MIGSSWASQVFNNPSVKSEILLDLNGCCVPVRVTWSPKCTTLVVTFHGAVDREKRPPPVYSPFISGLGAEVAQISISDPSMLLDGPHSTTWYAGNENSNLQQHLQSFFQEVSASGKFARIIFLGSSGGGFAALYFSSFISGSVAVVGMPQTNIGKYYSGHLERYISGCWPSLNGSEQLSEQICMDLCKVYSSHRPNAVIYLQSAGDDFHNRTQFAPFLAAIASAHKSRFIVNSSFWGRLGHSGSIPVDSYKSWLKAAIISPTIEVDDILLAYHRFKGICSQQTETAVNIIFDKKSDLKFSPHDLLRAEMLRDYHLRQIVRT